MQPTLPLAPQLREATPRITLNLEPVDPQLGHYYRYTPRSQIATMGKRMLEQSLLSELAPKDKEHQRKKILRQFFSDMAKSSEHRQKIGKLERETLFWKWVKSLNPDNVNSEERYKSMSYEFLDRLIGKGEFCEAFLPWLGTYAETLTAEEGKTKAFIAFIQKSAEVKREVETIVRDFLQDWSPSGLDEPKLLALRPSLSQPTDPGFYLEGKCFNERCPNFRRKSFFHFGTNTVISYPATLRSCLCEGCTQTVSLFANVGLMSVLYSYEGLTTSGETVTGRNIAMNCDEVQFYQWASLTFAVVNANEETTTSLQKLLIKVYREAKPCRKRPRVQPAPASPSVEQSKEGEEVREMLEAKRLEMKQIAEENTRLTEDIAGLKRELEQVRARQLYLLKMNLATGLVEF